MLMVQEILVNAAREGARAAILPNETDSAGDRDRQQLYVGGGGFGLQRDMLAHDVLQRRGGTEITLTVSVPCSTVSWLSYSTWFQGQTLTSSVTMMKE